MCIVPVSIPSPYNVFLYFLEGQVHKDSKCGIMTNVGKSRPVEIIFSNIHKINYACTNSFSRYKDFLQPPTLLKILVLHNFFFQIFLTTAFKNISFLTKPKRCVFCWLLWIQNYQRNWCFWQAKPHLHLL